MTLKNFLTVTIRLLHNPVGDHETLKQLCKVFQLFYDITVESSPE